jgi:tripartite ATP-independent transporter DctP family solute receptor
MKKFLPILLVAFLIIATLVGCGQNESTQESEAKEKAETPATNDKVIEIKLAGTLPEGHAITDSLMKFEEEVEKLSEGKVDVKVFPNMQLGGGREILEGVQLGTIQMCESSLAPLAGFNKEFLAFNLPYIFKSREIAYKFLDGEIGASMKDSVISSGFKILDYWENGIRHVTNNTRPIKTPEDLEGLKIRTMENPVHMESFRQMGANPTPMAFGEVFTALQQGAIDGQENPFSNINSMKFQEVQKYISTTGHFFDVTGFLINPDFFDSLPADIQEAIIEASKTATAYQRQRSIDDEAKYKEVMMEAMEFTELTPDDIDKFKEASKGTYDVFSEEIGKEKLQTIVEELEKIENSL